MLSEHLEKLQHFVGVVKAGSIRSYATKNNLSQPAISKSIQILEEALESNLLVRSREGVELTPGGSLLFDFANAVIAQSQSVESALHSNGQIKLTGRLVMGAYPSIAVYFVPRFFKFIQEIQEDLSLDLVSAPSAELISMVRSGKFDFVVTVDPPRRSDLFSETLYSDTYSLYRKTGGGEKIGKAPIFSVPSAKDSAGKTLRAYVLEAKLEKSLRSCGDFESVKAMIEQGVGFGLLPRRVAAPLLMQGKVEPVLGAKLNDIGPHSIKFTCRKHRASDRTLQWVLNQLSRMLRP